MRWLVWPFQFVFALGLESSVHRLMEQQEWREAVNVYERLIRWSPRQATFSTEAGFAHLMLNEWEPAEDRLREALRLDPHGLRAYDLLGILLANQGRIAEAQATWYALIEAAHSLSDRRPWLLSGFAHAHIQEARERLRALEERSFSGFPLESIYDAMPGSVPSPDV